MKIVKTTWFPFGSYDSMAMFPFVFIKGDVKPVVINHEKIHIEQQKELWLVGFYVLYVYFFAKFFLLYLFHGDKSCWDNAYYSNPFECEAYDNQRNNEYINIRQKFYWKKYL